MEKLENIFYKKIDERSNAKKFDYVVNHFQYFTMNTWNRVKSVANNVKVYNLKLNCDPFDALEALQHDNYININDTIENWEADHPGYSVGFNGRSGGYLVITEENNVNNIIGCELLDFETWEDLKKSAKEEGYDLGFYIDILKDTYKIIKDFDLLCDELRYITDLVTLDYKEETEEDKKDGE